MFKRSLISMFTALMASGGTNLFGGHSHRAQSRPSKNTGRNRIPGPPGKPGDKLARLAASRRVGLSTIR